MDVLENAHAGVTPGINFGKNGEGYLRISRYLYVFVTQSGRMDRRLKC